MRSLVKRAGSVCVVGVLLGAVAVLGAREAPAVTEPELTTSADVRQAVSVRGIFAHLRAFQRIADASGGVRVSGSSGYDESLAYAEGVLSRAGYLVTRQPFEFPGFLVNSPSVLQRISPEPLADLPHSIMSYSGSVDVSAPASVPIGSALGCATSDFDASNADTIVLIARGTCGFGQKAANALAAGAAAVVLYNNAPGALQGTLSSPAGPFTLDIAAVGITQELGQALVAMVPAGLSLHVVTDTTRQPATTMNLLAESPGGDAGNVVMAGAHLDSVPVGPGINDNGSGVATLLEVAERMRRVDVKNKVRFALWGAEEFGLLGSAHYVSSLSAEQRDAIALYLNFDMVGSTNYVRFVLDGDNSTFPAGAGVLPGPAGSGAIEQLFHDYFAEQGLALDQTPLNGRSDYGPFIAAGVDIPSGGLFSGADGIKTDAQAAVYGGTSGQPYDPCYHQPCDSLSNVNRQAIDELSDAVAHALFTYACDTSTVTSLSGGASASLPSPPAPRVLPASEDFM